MAKFTYEDKKEMVRLYNDEHLGYLKIANKFKCTESTVRRIIKRYNLHGEDSLIKKKNRNFSPEFKFEIINRVKNGESKLSLGIEYQIQESQIIQWLKNYEELGYDGLVSKPKGRSPSMKKEKEEIKEIDPNDKDAVIKQLEQRILELECENEALKKLRALVQKRNQQQTRKKQK